MNNPNRRCPNIDKAKKLINFKARINLDEGIQRFLKFIKEMN
jgi:UDP-glucuronate decarboxylase